MINGVHSITKIVDQKFQFYIIVNVDQKRGSYKKEHWYQAE